MIDFFVSQHKFWDQVIQSNHELLTEIRLFRTDNSEMAANHMVGLL